MQEYRTQGGRVYGRFWIDAMGGEADFARVRIRDPANVAPG
jgi:hypothetical protein